MTTVLVGALGFANYSTYTYSFPDSRQVKTKFALYAIAELVKPDQILVLLTEEAKTVVWDELATELGKTPSMQATAVDIPKGQHVTEMWQIFSKIADAVPAQAEIVLDITLGLRSIPVLVFSVVSYLRAVKNVNISGIFYGAVDAVGREVEIKPIFDLSEFVRLQDWARAVEQFNRTGDSILLAELLKPVSDTPEKRSPLPNSIKQVALALRQLSRALDFVRPDDVMKAASKLRGDLRRAAKEGLPEPFVMLLGEIRKQYDRLALDSPRLPKHRRKYLEIQYELIIWYERHERHLAAALLAREFIVSWFINFKGLRDESLFDPDVRSQFEGELRDAVEKETRGEKLGEEASRCALEVWKSLPDVRNDLAHAGMRKNPGNAENLAKRIAEAISRMRPLMDNIS